MIGRRVRRAGAAAAVAALPLAAVSCRDSGGGKPRETKTQTAPATAPAVPSGRVDVRAKAWESVGRPAARPAVPGPLTTDGENVVGVSVAGNLEVNKPTAIVRDVTISNGWLYVWTGSTLGSASKVAVLDARANGIGTVTSLDDFRIDGPGNDGLVLSKGGPPEAFRPEPYAVSTATNGVIRNKGYLPARSEAHADNIQLWSGKHYNFRGLFLGAMPAPADGGTGRVNSLIIVKSDIVPWDGSGDPITDVTFQDVYLDLSIGTGYNNVIYVREGSSPVRGGDADGAGAAYRDARRRHLGRPKMVTFRGIVVSNLANGAKPDVDWLINTSYQTDTAVFVKDEETRTKGIANQEADPSVIQRRIAALKASRDGMIWPDVVDAHSWIVWEDCQFQDGSPITPPGGFYDLSAG